MPDIDAVGRQGNGRGHPPWSTTRRLRSLDGPATAGGVAHRQLSRRWPEQRHQPGVRGRSANRPCRRARTRARASSCRSRWHRSRRAWPARQARSRRPSSRSGDLVRSPPVPPPSCPHRRAHPAGWGRPSRPNSPRIRGRWFRGVGQQPSEGHRVLAGLGAGREGVGDQRRGDVVVPWQPSVGRQTHRPDSRHRLGHRSDLGERGRRHRTAIRSDTRRERTEHHAVANHGHGHTGHRQLGHPLRQRRHPRLGAQRHLDRSDDLIDRGARRWANHRSPPCRSRRCRPAVVDDSTGGDGTGDRAPSSSAVWSVLPSSTQLARSTKAVTAIARPASAPPVPCQMRHDPAPSPVRSLMTSPCPSRQHVHRGLQHDTRTRSRAFLPRATALPRGPFGR